MEKFIDTIKHYWNDHKVVAGIVIAAIIVAIIWNEDQRKHFSKYANQEYVGYRSWCYCWRNRLHRIDR